jgi:Primase C terminal 1 (PriCT-1)
VTPDRLHSVEHYLGVLFPEPTPDLAEFRAFQAGRRRDAVAQCFAAPQDMESIERFILGGLHLRRDLFAGLAARRDATSGALGNCTTLGVVWADVDFKQIREAEAHQRLAAFPLVPTMTIHSGGGVHVYWGLSDALDVHAHEAALRSILRRLAHRFGADLSAAEPGRILRIPGTMNFKYEPARLVRFEAYAPSRRYLLEDLAQYLPPEPAEAARGRFRVPQGKVQAGGRNLLLFRLARSMKARGMSYEAALAAIQIENVQRCDPPHDPAEVERAVLSAFSQPDRPVLVLEDDAPPARTDEEAEAARATEVAPVDAPAPSTWRRYS